MSDSEKFWNRSAEKYAKSAISDLASYKKKLSETQSLLEPQMQVLEFGCGTGSTAIAHAPYVKRICALDISENMLEIGRAKARAAGVHNIEFIRSTLPDYNAEDSSFDVVLGLSILHLLPDLDSCLNEVGRVLKPGGLFISSTHCLGESFLRYIKLIAPLGKAVGLMPDFYALTKNELTAEIKDAGFEIERLWHHDSGGMVVFVIARKITSA